MGIPDGKEPVAQPTWQFFSVFFIFTVFPEAESVMIGNRAVIAQESSSINRTNYLLSPMIF